MIMNEYVSRLAIDIQHDGNLSAYDIIGILAKNGIKVCNAGWQGYQMEEAEYFKALKEGRYKI